MDIKKIFKGEFYTDEAMRMLYATDASAYKEMPKAVCLPKTNIDIYNLILYAQKHKLGLIPRTAGTSLAGQVVGNGIVVDVSRHFNKILEVNAQEKWVRVQMGVVRDELNRHLAGFGLMFAPETSTANRAMIGGMIGNNSCGANSMVYGSTREHIVSLKGYLSNGEEVEFTNISLEKLQEKQNLPNLEGKIYKNLVEILENPENQSEIRKHFPKPNIPRRNTGYALDLLLETQPFTPEKPNFDVCKLIAGSEGTLFFITEAKLNLVNIPPKYRNLVCGHYNSIDESLKANLICLKYAPTASELIDHYILDCTKENIEQSKNRFFIKGEPQAVLVVELIKETQEELEIATKNMIQDLQNAGLGYHFPVLQGEDMKKIWELRKAGLGLLGNIVSDDRPVPVIEDTAVDVQELPQYIAEFTQILKKYGLNSVHYAHAGSGELHLRPILNLKTEKGNQLFRQIAQEIAHLVKKYRGSLSGEHGDGRLRGEFIPFMLGENNYELLKKVKSTFDEHNIFNPNKIVDTPQMNTHLRYMPQHPQPQYDTIFDISDKEGIVKATELCNGSGDCRKSQLTGGTMCPSYMVTRHEKDTTRARANMLREILTNHAENPENSTQNIPKNNPFADEKLHEVLDLCLGCKGCKSECPSNVDITKMKAETLHQTHKTKGISLRTRLIANFANAQKLASLLPSAYNFLLKNKFSEQIIKKIAGFAPERSLPEVAPQSLRSWYKNNLKKLPKNTKKRGALYLFIDEFTNYNDVEIGKKAIQLLSALGYEVKIISHPESARTYLSKGLLKDAKSIAETQINLFYPLISENTPLVGIEPSAILGFRDEYIDLTRGELKEKAKKLAKNVMTMEEFFAKEVDNDKISQKIFSTDKKLVKLHGHCHQKALSSLVYSKKMLGLLKNYTVQVIPSGCCGMAGAFGYEAEHYELSMKVGELVLFPTIREQNEDTIIIASGTSCRHQIKDGTMRQAKHIVEVLWEGLLR